MGDISHHSLRDEGRNVRRKHIEQHHVLDECQFAPLKYKIIIIIIKCGETMLSIG